MVYALKPDGSQPMGSEYRLIQAAEQSREERGNAVPQIGADTGLAQLGDVLCPSNNAISTSSPSLSWPISFRSLFLLPPHAAAFERSLVSLRRASPWSLYLSSFSFSSSRAAPVLPLLPSPSDHYGHVSADGYGLSVRREIHGRKGGRDGQHQHRQDQSPPSLYPG